MSKKASKKNIHTKKTIDPFTSANDIQKNLVDKKKGKRSPQKKNRFDRQQQKEIVRQLTTELVELSEKDILEQSVANENPNIRENEVVYTIKPVNHSE